MMGRPTIDLPGGTPERHEAMRKALGLSRRAYARKIGVPPSTYMKKTDGVRSTPAALRRAEAKARRRQQERTRERKRELRAALKTVRAELEVFKARVREILRQLRAT